MKLKAVKEVHTLLAGLPPEPPATVETARKANPGVSAPGARRPDYPQPAAELSIPSDGASAEETFSVGAGVLRVHVDAIRASH